ncbi:hypothetical protein [Burkholderia orbicola]|uniref:hypothetical protein n=1 Tax=Burkholderia orbicola TaxID=2978683 RepID=UPI0035C7667E
MLQKSAATNIMTSVSTLRSPGPSEVKRRDNTHSAADFHYDRHRSPYRAWVQAEVRLLRISDIEIRQLVYARDQYADTSMRREAGSTHGCNKSARTHARES